MTHSEIKEKTLKFMSNIDSIVDNQNTLELLAMNDNQFWAHIIATLADGIGLSTDELKTYLNHDVHKDFLEMTLMFIRDLFCDQVMDKHG